MAELGQPTEKWHPSLTSVPFCGGQATLGLPVPPPRPFSTEGFRSGCEVNLARGALKFSTGQAGSGLHLDDVPLGQLPPGGDPHVVTIQLHHGCAGRRGMGVGELMVGTWAWQDSGLILQSRPIQGRDRQTRPPG